MHLYPKRGDAMSEKDDVFWKPTRIMSYNCLFNFIVGSTGCGKGFAITEMYIRKAIYEGKEFIHLRRSDVELKPAKKKFFDDMEAHNRFPGYGFRTIGGEYQCIELDPETNEPYDDAVWTTIGYAKYLSGARQQKSIPTPKVWSIWFDEFILPKKDWSKYLPDEVNTFLRFYDTVARMRDVKVFFVSNAECIVNPYFLYFNIHIPYNTDICRIKDDIAFEMVQNEAFRKMRRETRFGKLIAGTDYGEYAIENSFGTERHTDIYKINSTFYYMFSLLYNEHKIGVYRSNEEQKIVLSLKYDDTYRPRLELTTKDGKLNKMMITARNRNVYLNSLFQWYINGFVYYESLKVKQIMEPIMDKLA